MGSSMSGRVQMLSNALSVVGLSIAASLSAPLGVVAQYTAYAHAELVAQAPTRVAFSPNSRFLAVGTRRGEVSVFDVEAGRKVQSVQAVEGRVVGIAFTADGSEALVAGEDREIAEVDLLGGMVTRRVRTDKRVRSMDLSPDDRLIVWGGDDGAVELLTRRFVAQDVFESSNLFRKRVLFAAFGVEGSEVFVAAEDGRSAFWGLGDPDPIRQSELVREEFVTASRDYDGELLALGVKGIALTVRAGESMRARAHHKVQLFEWNRGRVVREIEGLPAEVVAVAVSPDRSLVVVADEDGAVDGYSTLETRRVLAIYDGEQATDLAFSPDGRWLAAALENDRVSVWEVVGAPVAAARLRRTSAPAGDILADRRKYEFTTAEEPLVTSFDRFTLAVLQLASLGVDESLGQSVTNLVVSRLANVPFIDLVERGAIEQVVGELRLQNAGITSASDAAEIGRILNAETVLLGNVNQFDTSVTMSLRLVETESARVLGARELLCRSCRAEDLPQAVGLLINALVEMR